MSADTLDPPVAPAVLAEYREGLRRQTAGDLAGSVRCLQNALRLSGREHPDIMDALAVVAAEGGDLAAAEKLLRRVLALRPGVAPMTRLAITLYRRQRFAEAAELFTRVMPHLAFNPDLEEAFSFSLENTGDFARSLAILESMYARAPSAAHAGKLAATLLRHGEHQRLAEWLPRLLAQHPGDATLLEAESANTLGLGDYPRGFVRLAARRAALGQGESDSRLTACPAWDGVPFPGTLLVSLENHVGEEIMVSSLLNELVHRGQSALVEVDARFLSLFRRSWPTLSFVRRGTGALGDCFAAGGECRRALSLDLARLFRRAFVLPGSPGWLRADPDRVRDLRAAYQTRWPGLRLVGISWRSARAYNGLDAKSIPLQQLAQTLQVPGVAFISLQYGDSATELAGVASPPWRNPDVDAMQDFEALAAQVAALDRVVTVSNVTAHFGGALGVPTTVLLPKRFPVLWHWGYEGEETTWYGSVRLLRNPRDGDWYEVDRLLAADLAGEGRYAGPDSRGMPA